MRVVAVDWSGDATGAGQRRHIRCALCEDGRPVSLTGGRDRTETVEYLAGLDAGDGSLVVGLDFAFSFPAWYLEARGLSSAEGLWDLAAVEGEVWLRDCAPPFWGRPGTSRPELPGYFRRTDLTCEPVAGIRPKSVFQIGGAGAVGTGSIRGMPWLSRLRRAGFRIWPFDPPAPGRPTVVEIYPRALTGPVVKSREEDRARYLQDLGLDTDLAAPARGSEDAFDAAVSAVVMSRFSAELAELGQATDPVVSLEGQIWTPGAGADVVVAPVGSAVGRTGVPGLRSGGTGPRPQGRRRRKPQWSHWCATGRPCCWGPSPPRCGRWRWSSSEWPPSH